MQSSFSCLKKSLTLFCNSSGLQSLKILIFFICIKITSITGYVPMPCGGVEPPVRFGYYRYSFSEYVLKGESHENRLRACAQRICNHAYSLSKQPFVYFKQPSRASVLAVRRDRGVYPPLARAAGFCFCLSHCKNQNLFSKNCK